MKEKITVIRNRLTESVLTGILLLSLWGGCGAHIVWAEGTTAETVETTDNPEDVQAPADEMPTASNKFSAELVIDAPERVRMYDRLPVTISLRCGEEDCTREILGDSRRASIDFVIKTDSEEVKINSKALAREVTGTAYLYYIPINEENFHIFQPEQVYTICAVFNPEQDVYDGGCNNQASVKVVLSERIARLKLSGCGEEFYDYRTYFGMDSMLQLVIDVRDITDVDAVDQAVCEAEISRIGFAVKENDRNVIKAEEGIYSPTNNTVALRVVGVGTTSIMVDTFGSAAYAIAAEEIRIIIENSPLLEEDFVIEYTPVGEKQVIYYSFEEWQSVLAAQDNWVGGDVTIALSEEGKRYYDVLVERGRTEDKNDTIVINGKERQDYCFWAEHTKRNASTKDMENGTREFRVGIDKEKPVIQELTVDENYFAPTKTETMQYYAQEFILKGSFTDTESGVKTIEYTTNWNTLGSDIQWQEAEKTGTEGADTQFRVALNNGDYPAIAVRACDYAGNKSDPCIVKNDKGAPLHIIVDDTVPVVQVRAIAGGAFYSGAGENWTNAGICYQLCVAYSSESPAGIYQYEYAYETIADAIRRENDEKMYVWETLLPDSDGKGKLQVGLAEKTDRNGYYYFQAVSKSGVKSKTPTTERILLQQNLAARKALVQAGGGTGRKNGWYNKVSGVPTIDFAYPEYDNGVENGEYDAPITLYYRLFVQAQEGTTVLEREGAASIGVMDSGHYENDRFAVTKEDLKKHRIDFGHDSATGYARDGIYTLEYWIGDSAGNVSTKECLTYKIDTHEPENLTVLVDGTDMRVDSADSIVYERFYASPVAGSASAEYGISGETFIKIVKAKAVGDWNDGMYEAGEHFVIEAGQRCFLYVIAEDVAGNIVEGWTRGIVVDNQPPTGIVQSAMIVEPQGANAHGFYNKDVAVKIAVRDVPDRENCAGLMRIACTAGREEMETAVDRELFVFDQELPTDAEISAAAQFETVQLIDAVTNESNHAYIHVAAVDRCGNTAVSTRELKIDVTQPEIMITFDNNDALHGHYFNVGRTATIRVRELNFDPSLVTVHITRDGMDVTATPLDWENDGSEHYARIPFMEDGDYTLSVKCMDLADNESKEVSTDLFTIDRTKPVVEVSLSGSDKSVIKEGYFHTRVTATITVTEYNFNPEDFTFHTSAVVKAGAWRQDGDIHTLELAFDSDGSHVLDIACSDLAGNCMDEGEPVAFTIDTIKPRILITGVADGSANAGEVIPKITVWDTNLEAENISIEVVTGRGDRIQIRKEQEYIRRKDAAGYVFTLPEMTQQEDDIYYLTVTAIDMAGNRSEQKLRFSLNRKGSTYDLSDVAQVMKAYYNTYEMFEDIKIIEMNVDKVEECRFYLSRNGAFLPEVVLSGITQSGSEQLGYTYVYTIARENFVQEGTYRLGIYSRDRAGNEVNNTLDANGTDIQFVIDNTAPKVLIEGVESGMLYDVTEHTVQVMVTDNFALCEAEFLLVNNAGEILMSWDYFDLVEEAGDIATLRIPECDEELSLLFCARDVAGNEVLTKQGARAALSNFLVTTNKWIQIVKKPTKTPIGIAVLGLVAVAGVIALFSTFVLYYKKHKLK